MYNGKLCASTTRYNDQTKAACGCGNSDPVPPDWWTLTKLTAAINCINLDPSHPSLSWCPAGCGSCYKLCSTGGTTQGKPTKPDVCRVFKVTNRCGDGYDVDGGRDWCSQHLTWRDCQARPEECKKEGSTNWFGYPAHFDLQDFHHQAFNGLGWDNVEVTFEPVSCSVGNWTGPAWDCQCPATKHNLTNVTTVPPLPPPSQPAPPPPVQGRQPRLPQQCKPAFAQCGGKYWRGATCCEPGCECTGNMALFWHQRQCVPKVVGAQFCNGTVESVWPRVIVRKDAIGAASRAVWIAEGTVGFGRTVGQTIVGGGLILVLAAVTVLGLGSFLAMAVVTVRQRLEGGEYGLPQSPLSQPSDNRVLTVAPLERTPSEPGSPSLLLC